MLTDFLSKKENERLQELTKQAFDDLQAGKDIVLQYAALSRAVNHIVLMMRHDRRKMSKAERKSKTGMVALMSGLAEEAAGLAFHTHWLVQEQLKDHFDLEASLKDETKKGKKKK